MLNIPLALQNLRLQQLLAPQPSSDMSMAPDDSLAVTGSFPQEISSYNPRTDISDAYSNALQNMPQREAPGKMRSIFGAMAGLGAGVHPAGISGGQPIGFEGNPDLALQTTDRVTNAPYYRKLGDWKTNVDTLGKGAIEEDRYNTNERIRANNVETTDIKQQQLGINQQKADILQQQADTALEKSRNIYEIKKAENERKIQEADAKLALAKQALDLKADDLAATREYHKAQLASIDARRRAQTDDDAFKLEEMKRLHDAQIARMEALSNKDNGLKSHETITELIDKDGKVTSDPTKAVRKVTRTGPPAPKPGMVRMLNRAGQSVDIPEDKVQDYITNYGGRRQ